VFLGNHITEVDADPEPDAPILGRVRLALDHAALDLNSAPDGGNHAGELGKEAVAGVLYDPAPVLGDPGLNQLSEMRFEPIVRPLLIRPHEARVPRHIGGKDRGEAADRGHLSRAAVDFV
jgi:hypothetical protein